MLLFIHRRRLWFAAPFFLAPLARQVAARPFLRFALLKLCRERQVLRALFVFEFLLGRSQLRQALLTVATPTEKFVVTRLSVERVVASVAAAPEGSLRFTRYVDVQDRV